MKISVKSKPTLPPEKRAQMQLMRYGWKNEVAKARFIREIQTGDLRTRSAAVQRLVVQLFTNFLYSVAVCIARDPVRPGEIDPECSALVASEQQRTLNVIVPTMLKLLPEGSRPIIQRRMERLLTAEVMEFNARVHLELIRVEEDEAKGGSNRPTVAGRKISEQSSRRRPRRSQGELELIREIRALHDQGNSHLQICRTLAKRKVPLPAGVKWNMQKDWNSAYTTCRPAVTRWLSYAIHHVPLE